MITTNPKKTRTPVDPGILDDVLNCLFGVALALLILSAIVYWRAQPIGNDLPHLEYRSAR